MLGVICVKVGVISSLCLGFVQSAEVILERATIDYFNKNYFSNASITVRRTGRKSPYYIHAEGTSLVWTGDNVTIHGVFYEFLHNEYKRGFVEIDIRLCDLTHKEPWYTLLGESLMKKGFICPSPPGTYRFYNMTVSLIDFPYVWPFEKAMLQGYAMMESTQEIILRGKIYVTVKRDVRKQT